MRLVCCVVAVLLSAGCSNQRGFDRVCQFYEELAGTPGVESLSDRQRDEYIRKRIGRDVAVVTSDAREAWAAASESTPPGRYSLFSLYAEVQLKRRWSCSPMERLFR